MTEEEYWNAQDVKEIFRALPGCVTDRQWFLWGVGCCRHSPASLDEIGWGLLEEIELFFELGTGPRPFSRIRVSGPRMELDGNRGINEFGPLLLSVTARPDSNHGQNTAILRDIVGPRVFRRVAVDPSWLTSTVVALARQMYEARDFSPMPILADALQDAGCDSAELLAHCRSEGPHVRGCWAVDLVLGKL